MLSRALQFCQVRACKTPNHLAGWHKHGEKAFYHPKHLEVFEPQDLDFGDAEPGADVSDNRESQEDPDNEAVLEYGEGSDSSEVLESDEHVSSDEDSDSGNDRSDDEDFIPGE